MHSRLALVIVLVATLSGAALANHCNCPTGLPCHYQGHCSAKVGGVCSPGTSACPDNDHPNDETPPTWSSGYPTVSLLMPRQINVDIIQSEPGFFYWVVLEKHGSTDPTPPTSAQVRAGTAPDESPESAGYQAVNAQTLATGVNMGLRSSTTYHIYLVAEDTIPNLQATPTLVIATTPSDPTPPTWNSGYPRISEVTETSIKFESRLNEDGIVYYVLVPAGGAFPSAANVKAGTVAGKVASGSDNVLRSGVTISSLITNVDPNLTYDLFVVAQDGDGNLQANAVKLVVTTDPPPQFASGFPRIVSVGPDRGTLEVNLGEPGLVYWCLLPAQTHAPASPQVVKSGSCPSQLSSGSIAVNSAGAVFSKLFTSLNPHSTYFVYMVPEDVSNNLGFTVTSRNFQTTGPDTTPPGYVLGFPKLKSLRDTWIEVETQLTEPGKYFVAVRLASAGGSPSAAAVKAGTDASFVTVGSSSVPSASTSVVVPQTGLTVQTDYVAWVVSEDTTGNLQSVPVQLPFTTTPDVSAPEFSPGYPKLENLLETSVDIDVQLNEPGDVWFMIVPTGASAPTSQAVVDGTGALTAGSETGVAANTLTRMPATGLRGSRTYDLYFVTKDGLGNRLDPPLKLTFTTANDVTNPQFSAGFPVVKEVQDKAVILTVKMNEDGAVYAVVVARGATAPTPSQVKVANGVAGAHFSVAELVAADMLIMGLTPSTDYDVYVLGEDVPGNQASPLSKREFTTGSVDTYPPRFINPYPRLVDITDTSVNLETQVSEPGTVYWALVPAGSGGSTPTCTQVAAGTPSGVLAAGNSAVATGGTTVTSAITSGISLGNAYIVYVCGKDSAGNMADTPVTKSFTASAVDSSAPTFIDTYPSLSAITDTSVTVVVQLSEPGNFYFIIASRNAAAPTAAQVKAGTGGVSAGSGGVAQAATSFGATGRGLSHSTDYDVWVVAEDTQTNLQGAPVKRQFTTSSTDLTPPTFAGGFPTVTGVTDSSCVVNVQLDEEGTVFYTILPEAATKPTTLQIRSGSGAVSSGSVSVATATTTFTSTATGLTIDTAYTLWAVAQDTHGNLQSASSDGVAFRTANVDTTPPGWSSTYPKIHVTTDTGVSVKVKLSEPSTVFLMVMPDGAAAPTISNIKAGTGGVAAGNGMAPTAYQEAILSIVSGLDSETDYDLYVLAQDGLNNVQAAPAKLDFRTTQDQTDPTFESGYPKAVNPAHDAVTLEVQLSEPGTVFFCIVANDAGNAFTSAQVRARNCGDSLAKGTLTVPTEKVTQSTRPQNPFFKELTEYDIILVAEDGLGNVQDLPTKLDFTTAQDTEAPTSTVAVSGNTREIVLDITISEPGTAYWVIVPAGSTAPASGDVTSGTAHGGNPAVAAGNRVVTVAPLTFQVPIDAREFPAGTGFDVYVVVVDDAGSSNRQNPPTMASIGALADGVPPEFLNGYPLLTGVGDTSCTVENALTEIGKWHVVALPQNAPSPSGAEVKAGTGRGGSSASAAVQNVDAPVATGVTSTVLTGLTPGAAYDVWVVGEDNAVARRVLRGVLAPRRRLGNLQSSPTRLQVIMQNSAGQANDDGGAGQVNDDGGSGFGGISGTWLPIIIVIVILLCALCICCCVRFYTRKQRKAKYHPVEPIVLARSRSGSYSSHGSLASEEEYNQGLGGGKHHGRRRRASRGSMHSRGSRGSRPGTGDSGYSGRGPPGSVNDDDEFGGGMDVVDLEADLQAAENVAQRAMNRPQEELQTSDHFSKDIMSMVGDDGEAKAAPSGRGAGAAAGAAAAGGGAAAAAAALMGGSSTVTKSSVRSAATGGAGGAGGAAGGARGGAFMMMEEEVTTTTTTEVVRVGGGHNPLDRAPLPNALASPVLGHAPVARHSGAVRRASLLAPLDGEARPGGDVMESILISEVVDGIQADVLAPEDDMF